MNRQSELGNAAISSLHLSTPLVQSNQDLLANHSAYGNSAMAFGAEGLLRDPAMENEDRNLVSIPPLWSSGSLFDFDWLFLGSGTGVEPVSSVVEPEASEAAKDDKAVAMETPDERGEAPATVAPEKDGAKVEPETGSDKAGISAETGEQQGGEKARPAVKERGAKKSTELLVSEETAVPAGKDEPAGSADGVVSGPAELTAWQAKVDEKKKSIKADVRPSGVKQVRASGAAAAAKAAEERRKQQEGAGKIIDPPPEIPDPLLPEEGDPVRPATLTMQAASSRKLPNQTMPPLVKTKGGVMPDPPRGLSAETGSKAVTTYGTDMEALDAEEKSAVASKNRKEIARIRKARKEREKKFKADWAEGKAEPITLVEGDKPPPALPMSEQTQADIGKVLAALTIMRAAAADDIVREARKAAFTGEVLMEPRYKYFADEALLSVGPYLGQKIEEIGKAAKIEKAQLEQYVAERNEALANKTHLIHGGLTDAEAFEKKKVKGARETQKKEGAGAGDAAKKYAGRLASEFTKGTDPKIVREKRTELVTAVAQKQGKEKAAYERAGERREESLKQTQQAYEETYKNAVDTERTNYFKAAWKARKNKAKEKEAALEEARTLVAPTIAWVGDELVPDLEREFTRLKKQAAAAVVGFITGLKQATEKAIGMIADWANALIGTIGNYWAEFADRQTDWVIQSIQSATAWETARSTAARDALVNDINTIRIVTRNEERLLKEEQAAGSKKIAEKKETVKKESLDPPPGPRDAILTVATQLKERLSLEQRPKLVEQFEKKVADQQDPERWKEVDIVAQAMTPGGQGAQWIGDQVRDATDRIGTQENKIYKALANMSPLQSQAVRLYYRKRYKSDIQSVLEGELSGAEEDRAIALLNREPATAGAAAIAYAVNPGFPGSGDVSAVMEVLRTTDDPAALRAKFKGEYDFDLDEYLERSLKGDDLKRAKALLTGDKTTRYVTDLKHAVKTKDRAGMEAVYAKIRMDVETKAAKVSEEVRSGTASKGTKEWDSQRIEEEVKARAADVEAEYNLKEKQTSVFFATTLREDIDKNMKGAERDLALALHEADPAKANAARLKLEDKGGKLKHNFWTGMPELTKGDAKAINNLIAANGERVQRDLERDEEIDLWNRRMKNARQYQVAYITGAKPDEIKALKPWNDEEERAASAKKVKDATENRKNDFRKTYEATYGSIDSMLDRNLRGEQRQKASYLVEQGGILKPEQTLHYAVIEKDADAVKGFLLRTPEAEMAEIKKNWSTTDPGKKWLDEHKDEASGGKGFENFLVSKFDGDNKFDISENVTGKAKNPREMLERKKRSLHRQKTQYFMASGDTPEAFNMMMGLPPGSGKDYELQGIEDEVADLEKEVKYIESLPENSPDLKYAKRSYDRQLGYTEAAVEAHRTAVERRTDDAAMIVGIIVTAIVIVATGGAATPFLAALAAGAGAAASIVTKALMKGGAYIGTKEMWTDIVVGVVDTVVSAMTAGLGGKLLKGIRPLAQMSKSARLAPRVIAHGLAEGAENFVATIPTSMAQQLMTKGELTFAETFTGAAIGAGLGGVLGSVGGFKKPGAVADLTSDILAHRGTPQQRLADWKLFKQANPGKTYQEFLSELDTGILSKQAREQAEKEVERKMRRELFEHIPPAQRGQFKDVPIRRVSDDEFERLTRSELGDAVVVVVKGKPQVIIREGADLSVLRREGKHLLQSVDPETAHLFRKLDEKKLAKWDRLSLDDQLALYKTKVTLEIDAQKRSLRSLSDDLAAVGNDPAARKRILGEMDDVRHTLDNLHRRAGEVADITPQQRRAMRSDKSLRPDYLDQPARLFEKRSRLTIKQELVAALKDQGVDTMKANRVLERLRVAAEAGGPKRPFNSVVKKLEALAANDPKAAGKYLEDLNKTFDNWIGDAKGVLAIVEASTKVKNPTAFLEAAAKLTGVLDQGVTRAARETLDAIGEKVSKMTPDAAHKYLGELGNVLDAFTPRKPSELAGFLRATAGMKNPTPFMEKLQQFAANRKKAGVDLPPETIEEIGDAMAKLTKTSEHKAVEFVDALDDFTRSHPKAELARLDGFIIGAPRARSGDPVTYLAAVKDLIAQKNHGLSHEALEMLARKAERRSLDPEWLIQTNIYKDKAARDLLDMAAKDVNTPWNLFRAADRHPEVEYLQSLLHSPARGMAGEWLTFVLGKELKAAGELLQDAGVKKTANTLKRAGIDELGAAQMVITTDKFGRTVIDTTARTKAGLHGLEVKAYTADYWTKILDAWDVKMVKNLPLDEAQEEAVKSLERMIKQLNNADAKLSLPPFLMTSTAIDKISPARRDILDDIIKNHFPPGTRILTIPEWEIQEAARKIKKLFSSK